jgi:hypothetical protein
MTNIVGSDKTVAAVRAQLEATSEIPKLQKTIGKDGKARAKKKAKPKTDDVTVGPGNTTDPQASAEAMKATFAAVDDERAEANLDEFCPRNIEECDAKQRLDGLEYRAREAYAGAIRDSLRGLTITPELSALVRRAADAWRALEEPETSTDLPDQSTVRERYQRSLLSDCLTAIEEMTKKTRARLFAQLSEKYLGEVREEIAFIKSGVA